MATLVNKADRPKVNAAIATAPTPIVQPKLAINEPGDRYEQEADAMADRVMRMTATPSFAVPSVPGFTPLPLGGGVGGGVYRKCTECEKDEKLHRKESIAGETPLLMRKTASGGGIATPALTQQLSQSKGGGSPLPLPTQQSMSQAFGTDFSGVRVHTDSAAAQMNQGIQARAFTHGSDIYFNRGEYRPESGEGKRLLAHELGHVVQQGNDNLKRKSIIQRHPSTPAPAPGIFPPSPPLPRELRIKGIWPPSNPEPQPVPAKYTSIDPILLQVLRVSYLEHHKNLKFLSNGFWGRSELETKYWPQTLWEALDEIDKNTGLNKSIVEVGAMAKVYSGIWSNVKRIRHCWVSSSRGFAFDTLGKDADLRNELNLNKNFCRGNLSDKFFSELLYHDNQDCWREVGTGGRPGLHICLGNNMPPNMHIDSTQVAKKREKDGTCGWDYLAIPKHFRDIH